LKDLKKENVFAILSRGNRKGILFDKLITSSDVTKFNAFPEDPKTLLLVISSLLFKVRASSESLSKYAQSEA
jgi:hypothetical protein